MKLAGLTQAVASLEPLQRMATSDGTARVYGLLRAARPAVAAALADRAPLPLLIVVAHPQRAHALAVELGMWTARPVSLFPAIEAFPYERVRIDRTVLADREAAVQRIAASRQEIVVAPARALLQPVALPDGSKHGLALQIGDTISLDRFLRQLVEQGYAEVPTVEEPGTFARRGGVLDVFSAGAEQPVRLELFGPEIESMRAFDPETQRSVATVRRADILPVAPLGDVARLAALSDLLEVDTSEMTAEARTYWLDDLGRLEAGATLDDLANLSPYLLEHAGSILDCMKNGTVVLESAREIYDILDDLWEQGVEVQRAREEAGDLPKGLKPGLIQPVDVRQKLAVLRTQEWHAGTGDRTGIDLSGVFLPAPTFGGRMRSLTRDLVARAGRSTTVVSTQAERVLEVVTDEDIAAREASALDDAPSAGITVVSGSIEEGWSLSGRDLLVLSDYEVFGHARTRPTVRARRAPRTAFFEDFAPGDYVVHHEHGIGRFDGVVRMSIEGVEREYALVQYVGTDRVYVPTDQLERLTKYVGVGGVAPHLNRLGGGEWQRAKQRAKHMAADIAKELIDVYAKRSARPGHAFEPDTPWQSELENAFEYPETPDQLNATAEVKADMEAPRPMDRLVCADVGYGKTEVAVRAAFKAIMNGKQVAVLVPTTVLAQQHFETFSDRLAPFPVSVEVLSRFRAPTEQRAILRRVASGEIDVLIGTHRLLQKDVSFKSLGLIIVDEEQRFGVRHKEQLRKLRETVDTLTLTATPIPRTLHMTLAGIREVSVIETAPEGRLPIKTYLQPYDDQLVKQAVLRELDRDGQVYVVHNKVASIEAVAERIRRMIPDARVIVAHGQLPEAQLERAMLSFAHHEADVLICSTIIENGLDIPNVNTIVVNNAHRLGLTQLYQLRGRVGRSANQAYAYLLYPRDARISHDAGRRMEAVFEAQELGAGFSIAMKDLEIRGAGNLLGAEQSGHAAAIGFDLYTRLISEAVDRLRGVPVEEKPTVSVDLPLDAFLPADYVNDEAERLTLYRRLAAVENRDSLVELAAEMRDRFGALPHSVENLISSVQIKLVAAEAGVTSVSLNGDFLSLRATPTGIYDRVALYREYGTDARISGNLLRIPRRRLEPDWLARLTVILEDMANLSRMVKQPEPVAG